MQVNASASFCDPTVDRTTRVNSNPYMAKKAASKKVVNTTRTHYFMRCSAAESALFERVSELEGHRTVQEWLLRLARLRARTVKAAEENGTLDQL